MSGGFRHLVQAVAMLPAAERDVAEAVGIRLPHVAMWFRVLRQKRIVHCQRVVQRSPLLWDRVYAIGDGINAVAPQDALRGERTAQVRGHVMSFALLWRALETPATTAEIAHETGICQRSVCLHIATMRDAGLVHIAAWTPAGKNWAPNWAQGRGTNVPRPRAQTRTAINLRYYRRSRERQAVQPLQQALSMGAMA